MKAVKLTVDRTTLNIITLVIAGVGIVGAFSDVGVPAHDAHATFFGGNPFAAKREIIADHIAFGFATLAGFALMLQLATELFGWPSGNDRRRGGRYYFGVLVVAGLVSWGLFAAVVTLSRSRARVEWLPLLANDGTRQTFAYARSLGEGTPVPDMNAPTRSKEETAEEHISTLERMFDVTPEGDMRARLARLAPIINAK